MRIPGRGIVTIALLGLMAAPAFAQAKAPRASTTQVKVFAEPG